eukprot:3807652-Rhodomonas_salina.2
MPSQIQPGPTGSVVVLTATRPGPGPRFLFRSLSLRLGTTSTSSSTTASSSILGSVRLPLCQSEQALGTERSGHGFVCTH